MPGLQISDPYGLNGKPPVTDKYIMEVVNGDTVPLVQGTVVQLNANGIAPGAQWSVHRCSATAPQYLVIGVVLGTLSTPGGSTNNDAATSIPVGGVGQIVTQGHALILCEATTAVGNQLVPSTTTAGIAKLAPGTQTVANIGEIIGVALQAVTISSGSSLVSAYIRQV